LQEADVFGSTVSSEGGAQPVTPGGHGIKRRRMMVGRREKMRGREWNLDVWSGDGNLKRRRKKETRTGRWQRREA
jgi:hypothetical protein